MKLGCGQRRGQPDGRLGSRGEHAQIAAAVDVEVERERHHDPGRHRREITQLRVDTRGEQPGVLNPRDERDIASVPVQRHASRDAARIRHTDVERRLAPERLDGPAGDRAHVGPDEPSRDFQVRAVHDHLEEATFAHVGLDRAGDLEQFRKKRGPRDELLLLSGTIGHGVPVRHREHGTPDRLRSAPGATDLLHDRIPPRRALAHNGLDHLQREEQADEERRHYDQSCHRRCPQNHPVLQLDPRGFAPRTPLRRRSRRPVPRSAPAGAPVARLVRSALPLDRTAGAGR